MNVELTREQAKTLVSLLILAEAYSQVMERNLEVMERQGKGQALAGLREQYRADVLAALRLREVLYEAEKNMEV